VKLPWMKFNPSDWLGDECLQSCQTSTQGIWINLCCRMWISESGSISRTAAQLGKLCSVGEEAMLAALLDLQQTGTAEIQPELSMVSPASDTVLTVTSRRLSRDCHDQVTTRKRWNERQKKHRLKLVTPESPIPPPLDIEVEVEEDKKKEKEAPLARVSFDFAVVYERYPRKKGKARGLISLKAQVRSAAEYQAVLRGVDAYAEEVARERTEAEFIPYFSTWVNEKRWLDYTERQTGNGQPSGESSPRLSLVERIKAREEAEARANAEAALPNARHEQPGLFSDSSRGGP
jgi:hypothetical protein